MYRHWADKRLTSSVVTPADECYQKMCGRKEHWQIEVNTNGRNNWLTGNPSKNDELGTVCKYPVAQYTPLSMSLSPPPLLPYVTGNGGQVKRKRRTKDKRHHRGRKQTTKEKEEGRQALSTRRLFKSWFIDREEQLYASQSRPKPFFLLLLLLLLFFFFLKRSERVKIEVRWPSWVPRP